MAAKFNRDAKHRLARTVVGVNGNVVSEIRAGDVVTVRKVRGDEVLIRSETGLLAWVSAKDLGEYHGEGVS